MKNKLLRDAAGRRRADSCARCTVAVVAAARRWSRLFAQDRQQPADVVRDGQQRDADAGAAAEHPALHRRAVQISQDDRDHRRGRFRQRSGHQRAGAVLRAGVAAAGFPRRPGQGRAIRWRRWIRPTLRRPSAPIARRSPPPRPPRRLADLDKDLLQHNGVAQREAEQAETDAANAEADRDAALQALVSLNVDPQTIKDIQDGRPVSRARRHDPLADRGHRGGKTDHARRTAAGGHHAVFHRRRSFARLGHGAGFRLRPGVGQRRRSGRSATRHRDRTLSPEPWTTSRRWWIPTPVR